MNSNRRNGPRPVLRLIGASSLLFLFLGLAPALSSAADPGLPKGEQILDDMVKAQGGADAFGGQKNRVTYGSMEIKPMGVTLGVVQYSARPNLNYVTVTGSQLGKIESGVKGELAWENSSMAGPKVKEATEKADALREAEFDGLLNWRKLYSGATCTQIDTIDGKPCYRVIMVPFAGSPDTSFFSRETGLLVQSRTTIETEMGKVPVVVYIDDYRKVDGLLWPFRTRQVIMGGLQEMILKTDSVRVNVDLPPDRFDPPAEVKALLEKAKSGEGSGKSEGKKPEEMTPDERRSEEKKPQDKTGTEGTVDVKSPAPGAQEGK